MLVQEGFAAEDISELLSARQDAAVWLDLHNPTSEDLQIVTDEFGLHPLAVEDAVKPHQRPKVDRYRTHLFANMYAVTVGPDASLTFGELSAFITPRALITVRKDEFDVDVLLTYWDLDGDLMNAGNQVATLVYGLLDAVVDGHYRAIDRLDEVIDELQERLFQRAADSSIRRRAYDLSGGVASLRRVVAPMQEVLSRVMRTESRLLDEELAPYFQDVNDHIQRTVENVDAARDRLDRIADTQRGEQDAQLNETTRKLAAWAAIIAVPTAITGFYGQNVPYPGFGHHSGFIASITLMVVLAVGLYLTFRHNKWL